MLWVLTKVKKYKIKYALCKGMTLIEVIIAVVLMSILAMGIFSALANQVGILNRSKDITINSFSNQSEVEKNIEEIKSNIKFSTLATWKSTLADYSSRVNRYDAIANEGEVGKKVELYKMKMKDSKGKITSVFLSSYLASDEKYITTLEAKEVDILVNNDNTKTVASILGSVPTVIGKYIIEGTNYYASVCKWYASVPGIVDPQWPTDYQQITRKVQETGLKPNYATVDFLNLNNYVNRYIVFTVQPADGNGIRSAEVPSKRVLILGAEWRNGGFSWADKNGNSFFDGSAINKDTQLVYNIIDGKIDYETLEVTLSDIEKTDIKNGSLFVPRCINGITITQGTANEIKYEKDIVTNNAIDWKIQNGIHFANKIISVNPVRLKTDNGPIVFYRFVQLDSSGSAIVDATGYRLKDPGTFNFESVYSAAIRPYHNLSAEIKSQNNVYLGAYGTGLGFIYIQPFSSINGANIVLEAEEPITIYNSALALETLIGDNSTMNREILLSSIKDISIRSLSGFTPNYIKGNPLTKSTIIFNTAENITVENTIFKDIDINLMSNATLKGVKWSLNKVLSVKDGSVIKLGKDADGHKINNEGQLMLGNTGSVQFITSMSEDLVNPLQLSLTNSGINTVTIGSNYGRTIGYADPAIVSPIVNGGYQDIGYGKTNLQYKIDLLSGNISNINSLTMDYNGENSLTIVGTLKPSVGPVNLTLTVKDKYMPGDFTKSINITLTN